LSRKPTQLDKIRRNSVVLGSASLTSDAQNYTADSVAATVSYNSVASLAADSSNSSSRHICIDTVKRHEHIRWKVVCGHRL